MENDIFVSGLIDSLDKFTPPAAVESVTKGTVHDPLVHRLKRFLDNLECQEKNSGLPFEVIRSRLKGTTTKTNAHAAELSDALRKLGWYRVRSWNDGRESFRALWFPPVD